MLIRKFSISLLVAMFVFINKPLAEELEVSIASIKTEINDYKSKTDEIKKKIKHEKEKALSDSSSYLAYLDEYNTNLNRMKAERDSLLVLSQRLQDRRDSLGSEEVTVNLRKESIVVQNKNILSGLQIHCKQLIDTLASYEPYNAGRLISALKFLEGELVSGTINAPEGIERYWQIVSQIEQASQKIEVWKGASPVSALKGDVQFIRMGFIWLACVGNESSSAFIYNKHIEKWELVKNDEQVTSICQAVKLSTGMASPQLVALPIAVELVSVPEDISK